MLVGTLIALVVSGCVHPGDDGGRRPAPKNGTIEKMVAAAQRKYDRDQAEMFQKLADDLRSGRVIDKQEAWKEIGDTLSNKYKADFAKMNKLLDYAAAQGRGKFGKRDTKYFEAIARGFNSLAGDRMPNDDDQRDERDE